MRRWESETGTGSFEAKRGELGAKKTELDALEGERRRRLQELESDRVREQRDAFLDQHRLANASIPGIGQGRKVTLESFGIETAKDVESSAIAGVPGFGPALTRKLLDWREGIARKFVFDPSRPVDPRAVAAVERDIDARRARILAALSAGPAQLRAAAQDIDQRRSVLRSAMEDAARAFTQARADLEAR